MIFIEGSIFPFSGKIISTYAACIIFHGYESHIDDAFLARKLYTMETVKKELDIRGIEPALVPIVWCLKTGTVSPYAQLSGNPQQHTKDLEKTERKINLCDLYYTIISAVLITAVRR